ncbi:MAG: J domain-containing protein [Prevotella sp.]|nr:J domain-containing protein [Prevotella sp.]
MKDPYKVLGIKTSDTLEVAKSRYRKLCMQYHPDRNPGNPTAEAMFRDVQDAWNYLKDRIGKEDKEPLWVHTSLFSIIKKGACN